ncbi:DEAD/DEAH box helicase [Candidatus Hepatincolaceae symbiont of Richtersius coronifer]
METFTELDIPNWLKNSLIKMGYTQPTSIQSKAIPLILSGKDILGTAQTGTGKTGAFLIPLIAYLEKNKDATALILTPTRELAAQVHKVAVEMLRGGSYLKSVLLIGGESISRQFYQLESKPRLIVGTPGRVNDHINQGSLNLKMTSFVVLDETDRMLDMGFGVQIDEIFQYIAPKKQTLLFSATLPAGILKIANKYLIDPVRVRVGEVNAVAKNLTQKNIDTRDKFASLIEIITAAKSQPDNQDTFIIFVKTKRTADLISEKLYRLTYTLGKKADNETIDNSKVEGSKTEGAEEHHYRYKVDVLHGGLKQSRRNSVTKAYREKKFDILIATDVASRGLDIPHITYVINYDIPANEEDYVHRIGRTARADKPGTAITFIASAAEKQQWNKIQRFIGKDHDSAGLSEREDNGYDRRSFKPRGDFNRRTGNKGGNQGFGNRSDSYSSENRGNYESRNYSERPKSNFSPRAYDNDSARPQERYLPERTYRDKVAPQRTYFERSHSENKGERGNSRPYQDRSNPNRSYVERTHTYKPRTDSANSDYTKTYEEKSKKGFFSRLTGK